ncbi:DUF6515 family protein [Lentiprolixibacter aurantiacus]|uniref:DUF6515 family protein n=1 Tax=Lentiprolixibacter aurantiacus TaxID=2993939 RepID=A0AAE3SQ80_9FLAO|nr:DUF6515 family protein [Lentiprolixibacter aurantiacus]MCX2720242.1 DUF6515 family protein [Lentiprolixibacter aurantiacus]
MKSLKSLFVITFLLAGFAIGQASNSFAPQLKIGVVVTKVHKPKIYVHKGVRFHYSKGIWYRTSGNRYVVAAAPVGVVVRTLPRGRKVVRINGRKYYRFNGVYYQKRKGGYIVVSV